MVAVRDAQLSADDFHSLRPTGPNYMTAPIEDAFNWGDCVAALRAGEWYLVVFRSVRRDEGENLTLEMYDYGAYLEAQRRASGLLFYFRGEPNARRECLSFCIWTDRAEAGRASRLPLHASAMSVVDSMYESYRLERYIIRKRAEASVLEFEPQRAPSHR